MMRNTASMCRRDCRAGTLFMSPDLARSRHIRPRRRCLLCGVERTRAGSFSTSAFDSERTLADGTCKHPKECYYRPNGPVARGGSNATSSFDWLDPVDRTSFG